MVKHIVFWKLKPENKEENARELKKRLEGLKGKIEGLIDIEVGFDFVESGDSVDVALYSTFEDKEALEHYHQHPLHTEIIPFIGSVRTERRVVDYEV